jgi:hypothetical protein
MSQSTAPGAAPDVAAAFEQLTAALDVLTSASWWQLPDGELVGAVVALHRAESRVAAAQVGALADAGSRGLPAGAGFKDGAGWLRGLVPVTPAQASARAGLAEALPAVGLAPTRAALAAGAISPGQAGFWCGR